MMPSVSTQQLEAFERLAVRDRDVLGPTGVLIEAVLRTDAGIIEARRDAVRLLYLAALVLQQVRLRAVKHAGPPLR